MSFGMMEAMLSFLRRQVGLRTDSADAAGSLHAKIGTVQKPRASKVAGVFSTTTLNNWVTALQLSGKGKLNYLKGHFHAGNDPDRLSDFRVRITVDGVVVSDAKGVGTDTDKDYYPGLLTLLTTDGSSTWGDLSITSGYDPTQAQVSFASSLKLEIYMTNLATYGELKWEYELE